MTFIVVINVNALDINIDEVNIKEKSDKTIVDNTDITNLTITPDIEFSEVGESVTYEIKLKNNTNNKYRIKEIKDNNTNEYIKTSYKVGNSISDPIYITFKYDKKTSNLDFNDTKISIVTTKITDLTKITNPKGGQLLSIIFLLTALLLSLLYAVISMKKKQKNILGIVIALLLVTLINTKAAEGINITIKGDNIKVKKLEFVPTNVQNENTISIGDEYCFGEECFYVVDDSDPEIVTLLTKNILYAGTKFNWADSSQELIPSDSEDYCLQKKSTNEYKDNDEYTVGSMAFAAGNYWMDNNTGRLKSKYGPEEPLFPWEDTEVYDLEYQGEPILAESGYPGVTGTSNYSIAFYVEQYINKLHELGIENITGRLLSYKEVYRLGCNERGCNNAPSWLYSSAYWLSTASGRVGIWGEAGQNGVVSADADRNVGFGIRPVIEIPMEYLKN